MTDEWTQVWLDFHHWIDSIPAASRPHPRQCHCGAECYLKKGRNSGQYFYVHPSYSACEPGGYLFFASAEEAIASEKMFRNL